MKKFVIALAAVATGFAATAEVSSGNAVGYNTITLPAGQEYGMYALPFDKCGDEGGMTIYEIFPEPLNSFHGGVSAANADQIQFWYNGTYRNLYLFSNTKVATRHGKWINPGVLPDSSWGTANQPTAVKLPGGTAFWIKRYVPSGTDKSNAEEMAAALPAITLKVSGQVVTKQSGTAGYTITAATADTSAYTLCAAGFSEAFAPNPDKVDGTKAKIDWFTMGCRGGVSAANADQLMLWYGGTYRSLYLFSNTKVPARHGYWINPGVVPDASWGTANQPSTAQIQPTQGFWYMRQKGGTESFTFSISQPYTLD